MTTNAPVRQITDVKSLLKSPAAFAQIESVAAKHLSGERMARVMANAVRVTPSLADCEPMSFLGAMMTSASLGLEPNTPQGHAYLIPFNNRRQVDGRWVSVKEAQLIIGYKGFIDLAFRTGTLTYLDAGIHYADDDLWEYEKGTSFRLRHAEGPQQRDKLHAYAIVKWSNGAKDDGTAAVVLPWSKVMSTRDQSQGWQTAVRNDKTDKSPWHTHEDAMAMKTAIRALANSGRMPMSIEMQTAMAVDDNRGVDFRSFAVDPALGAPNATGPNTDGPGADDFIEGEVTEGKPEQEDQEQKAKPKPQKKEVDPKPKDKPKEKPKQKDPAETGSLPLDDQEQDKAPEPDQNGLSEDDIARFKKAANDIELDLLDAGANGVDEVKRDHADIIAEMQDRAPDMWKPIEALIKDL